MREAMALEEIPEFVEAVIEAGASIVALDDNHYVVGDTDLTDAQAKRVHRIASAFGERDHLRREICRWLISIGRVYQPQ